MPLDFERRNTRATAPVRRNGVTVIVWKKSDSQIVASRETAINRWLHRRRTCVWARAFTRTQSRLLVESSLPVRVVSHTSYYEKYLLPHRRTFRLALCPLITYLNGSTRTRDDPHDWITCSEASTRPRLWIREPHSCFAFYKYDSNVECWRYDRLFLRFA